jgi:hypothetical protein
MTKPVLREASASRALLSERRFNWLSRGIAKRQLYKGFIVNFFTAPPCSASMN